MAPPKKSRARTPTSKVVRKTGKSKSGKSKSGKPSADTAYEVVLREGGGTTLTARVIDRVLYPSALAWNRLLSSDQGRQTDQDKEAQAWRDNGRKAILDLGESGKVSREAAEKFIVAASKSGIVQVEMSWVDEGVGWASRIFPWEALLALGTKDERKRIGQDSFVVVRRLTGGMQPDLATNPPMFVVTEAAEATGFDYQTEQAAINEALQGTLQMLRARSLMELSAEIKAKRPRIVHLVLNSAEKGVAISVKDLQDKPNDDRWQEQVAKAVAAHGPEIVVFSSCYTGRRLAPLAVAHGARIAIGFQGEVTDACLPVFFGAFYRTWRQNANMLDAMRAGLEANHSLAKPDDLGTVTLWSSTDLIRRKSTTRSPASTVSVDATGTGDGNVIPPADVESALPVICVLEETLNYSVLHNSRGGLFKVFVVTKIKEGKLDPLEVSVRLDTGLERPAECHFFAKLPVEADRQHDLSSHVTLPLGSQLLRQRGEALLGTVEVVIKCGTVQVFHKLQSIKLLPCDEWRDDETGRHLLPSFIFPRDPAVRDILTAAQPFLRALADNPLASFAGYPPPNSDPDQGVTIQTQAIWAALQYAWHLDYVNPPPTYTKASQRLRTPEEILRARRGTCIELSLLLASCWEHVGIFPVIFLTTGHAFAGFWTSEQARSSFIDGLGKMLNHASTGGNEPPEKTLGGKRESLAKEPWMLAEPHHLVAIRAEVQARRLVPIESTFIPLQRSYADAIRESVQMLIGLPASGEFDGMLDVQTAREKGVTPLAIITQGAVA